MLKKIDYRYLCYIKGAVLDMKYNLPDRIIRELSSFAQKYSVTKIILFGFRARGTNTERSDIDIAVYGGDFEHFYWDVKEKTHSLLMFDIVQAVSYYKFTVINYIGFHDKGMLLVGGCGDTNGEPQIDKTNHLKEAYEFGKAIYNE